MRRVIDFLVAMVGLVILSPLFLVISLLIKIDSSGPIFYRAKRVGQDGQLFSLYKFRSMVVDADKNGPAITNANDRRVTTVGRILRKTKFDELPQLLNVLKGDMSLVGPRPEDPAYVALYTKEQRQILRYKPGITSAASFKYRNEAEILTGADWEELYRNKVMPAKIEIDLNYLLQRSIWSDFQLVLRTILGIVR